MVEPYKQGRAGKVWKIPPPKGEERLALVEAWLIEQPGVHAFWSRWIAQLIHLRPQEGVKPAKLAFPEATHEIIVAALDPETYGEHDAILEGESDWRFVALEPWDQVHQFQVNSDAEAIAVIDAHMEAIVQGGLSPDSDFRSAWERTVKGTAEHFRSGKHGIA